MAAWALTRRVADAQPHYRRAIALVEPLVRAHPSEARYPLGLAGTYQNLGLIDMAGDGHRLEAAAQAYQKAKALLRPLVDKNPQTSQYATTLSTVYNNWSYVLKDIGQPHAALRRLSQAIELARTILRLEPRHAEARECVYCAQGTRAEGYEQLGRYADAARDWDTVVEMADEPNRTKARLSRAGARVRAGDHRRSTAEARALADAIESSDDVRYNAACADALAAAGPSFRSYCRRKKKR